MVNKKKREGRVRCLIIKVHQWDDDVVRGTG